MGGILINKSTYEAQVDWVFNSLKIRQLDYREVIKFIEKDIKGGFLTETGFQTFYNNYLRPKDTNHQHLLNYWLLVYKNKDISLQYNLIKFNLLMLCKTTADESFEKVLPFIKEIISEGLVIRANKIKKKPLDGYINLEDLYIYLFDYIRGISYDTIEYFKVFHFSPDEFSKNLNKTWSLLTVNEFVKKTFLEEEKKLSTSTNIEKFFKLHWDLLKNDNLIRSKLTEFSLKFSEQDQSHLVLSTNKLFDD